MAAKQLTPEEKLARRRESSRKYYEKNRAKVSAKAKAAWLAHPEKYREWAAAHPEEMRERRRRRYEKHREKILEATAAYAAAHPEQTREYKRKYYENNSDKVKQRAAASAAANPEKERERQRKKQKAWAESHPEEARARGIAYRQRHPRSAERIERDRARSVKWAIDNPEKALQAARNRRARQRGASGRHTALDVARLFDQQRSRCAACGVGVTKTGKGKYHIDHVMPLALGGSNGPENLQLLCKPCNLRKAQKHPDDWARANGKLFI